MVEFYWAKTTVASRWTELLLREGNNWLGLSLKWAAILFFATETVHMKWCVLSTVPESKWTRKNQFFRRLQWMMLPEIRLCYPTGVANKVVLKSDGFTVEGPGAKTLSNWIAFFLKLGNVTQLVTPKTNADCMRRFERNQSDFALGYYDIHDTEGKYYAPVPALPLSLHFLSGYNVYEYRNEKDNWAKQQMGVLQNFKSYQPAVYALGTVWLIALFAAVALRVVQICKRPRFARVLNKSFSYFCLLKNARCRRWRLLSLLFHTALFFFVTPFCILFKTNQVVTKEPPLITSYEQIMSQKVEVVYTHIQINDTDLLLQQSWQNKAGGTMDRMWKYFKTNSRHVLPARNPETFELLTKLSQGIVDNKLVFLASLEIAEAFRQVFCSWAVYPNYYQILMYRDPHQREIITGYAFRMVQPPKVLVKRLLTAFEMHIPSTLISTIDNYAGLELFPSPNAHKQRQLLLCQRKSVVQYHKEELLANDFQFFGSFFARIVIALVLACVCVALEMFVGQYFSKEKHRRRNLH